VELQTHGRWPWVAATALGPVSALAVRRPPLRPLAALLWHQTEEWVWPGGFLPWMNREMLGSDRDEFPLDRRLGLIINVAFGWGASLATMAGARAAGPAGLLYVSHFGNAGMHLSWAARHRRYDPGSITSVLTLIPVAVAGFRQLIADPHVSRRALGAGALGGVVLAAALPGVLKRRLRSAGA
jgi:Protein of unknown function with HXXEE motif